MASGVGRPGKKSDKDQRSVLGIGEEGSGVGIVSFVFFHMIICSPERSISSGLGTSGVVLKNNHTAHPLFSWTSDPLRYIFVYKINQRRFQEGDLIRQKEKICEEWKINIFVLESIRSYKHRKSSNNVDLMSLLIRVSSSSAN